MDVGAKKNSYDGLVRRWSGRQWVICCQTPGCTVKEGKYGWRGHFAIACAKHKLSGMVAGAGKRSYIRSSSKKPPKLCCVCHKCTATVNAIEGDQERCRTCAFGCGGDGFDTFPTMDGFFASIV